jgi:hypothetical protein
MPPDRLLRTADMAGNVVNMSTMNAHLLYRERVLSAYCGLRPHFNQPLFCIKH